MADFQRIEAIVRRHDQQSHLLPLTFYHGVGSQGCGNGHQFDLGEGCRLESL